MAGRVRQKRARQRRLDRDALGGVGRAGGSGNGGTFADLTGWAYDDAGEAQSFLSTEENFRFVKALPMDHLVYPHGKDEYQAGARTRWRMEPWLGGGALAGLVIAADAVKAIEDGAASDQQSARYDTWLGRIEGWPADVRARQFLAAGKGGRFDSEDQP